MAKGQNFQNTVVIANTIGIDTSLKMLNGIRNGQRDALIGGINDTLKSSKTFVSKLIRGKVNINKKDIDPYIKTRWATKAVVNGALFIKEGERIPLKYFGARETKKGVTYKIDKGGARKSLPSGFIIDKYGGHVFLRRGKKRFPLKKPLGVSAWGTFVKNEYIRPAQGFVYQNLEKNVTRRVNFLLLKHAGKI